ncbi:hypothetical protein HPB48_012687 [Haemaphysalis longicornis]|uniref:Uncharacterized protein n=1 Tax=Haemaphysalis longicornis TaxID=44386 RepID=A0A9J6G013_HAELO|nr:hypothetical protein HPB48_012687 [Haemaphysalis longicornis]
MARKPHLRILGFYWQQNGRADVWVQHTLQQINHIANMLKIISHKIDGVKEAELRRITEALVYTRIMYGLPCMRVTEHQFRQINNILRRITRITLGIPNYAASTSVEGTAIYNTLSDRRIMHQEAQSHRLTSKQGQCLGGAYGIQHCQPTRHTTHRTTIGRHPIYQGKTHT